MGYSAVQIISSPSPAGGGGQGVGVLGPQSWLKAGAKALPVNDNFANDNSPTPKAKVAANFSTVTKAPGVILSLLGKGLAAYRFGDQAKDYYDAIQFALSTIPEKMPAAYWELYTECTYSGADWAYPRNSCGLYATTNPAGAGYKSFSEAITVAVGGKVTVYNESPWWQAQYNRWVYDMQPDAVYTRKAGSPSPTPLTLEVPNLQALPAPLPLELPALDAPFAPALDPNIWRAVPSTPARPISPVTSPNPFSPLPSEQLTPMVLPVMRYEGQIGEPVPPIRGRPQPKKPPRNDTKKPSEPKEQERKTKGKASAVAALFAALDVVSEAAEVVDAFYEALPEDVKAEAEARARPRGGLLDNAGQYGIDGADWKGQALWDNWDRVDIDQALKNVVVNEMQDKFLGTIHQGTPKNTGSAVDGGFKAANKAFEWAVGSFGW